MFLCYRCCLGVGSKQGRHSAVRLPIKLAEWRFVFLPLDVGSLEAWLPRIPDSLSLKLGRYLGSKLINCSRKFGYEEGSGLFGIQVTLGTNEFWFLRLPSSCKLKIIVTTKSAADTAWLGAASQVSVLWIKLHENSRLEPGTSCNRD